MVAYITIYFFSFLILLMDIFEVRYASEQLTLIKIERVEWNKKKYRHGIIFVEILQRLLLQLAIA